MLTTAIIVAKANEVLRKLDGTMEPIKCLIADNELVFAVWQDRAERDGIETQIIKDTCCWPKSWHLGKPSMSSLARIRNRLPH